MCVFRTLSSPSDEVYCYCHYRCCCCCWCHCCRYYCLAICHSDVRYYNNISFLAHTHTHTHEQTSPLTYRVSNMNDLSIPCIHTRSKWIGWTARRPLDSFVFLSSLWFLFTWVLRFFFFFSCFVLLSRELYDAYTLHIYIRILIDYMRYSVSVCMRLFVWQHAAYTYNIISAQCTRTYCCRVYVHFSVQWFARIDIFLNYNIEIDYALDLSCFCRYTAVIWKRDLIIPIHSFTNTICGMDLWSFFFFSLLLLLLFSSTISKIMQSYKLRWDIILRCVCCTIVLFGNIIRSYLNSCDIKNSLTDVLYRLLFCSFFFFHFCTDIL